MPTMKQGTYTAGRISAPTHTMYVTYLNFTPSLSNLNIKVLMALIPSSLRKAFRDRKVYLNFLVCGGFVENPETRSCLFCAARKYG